MARGTRSTQGSDSRRKIRKALKNCGGSVDAETLSELRQLLNLAAMNAKDLAYNLLAMNAGNELATCNLTAGSVKVVLAGQKTEDT